jgi:hypothetical protein
MPHPDWPYAARTPGQIAYEEDLAREPCYGDGTPRKTWHQLSDDARWSWERKPTPRAPAPV